MDVYTIKQHIINNPEYIEVLLEWAGFYKIRNRGKEYRCAFDLDTNDTSVKVNKDTLGASDFGRGIHGDIISLLEYKTGMGFRELLKNICSIVNLSEEDVKPKEIILPFGGFFKNIGKNREKYEELEILDESILDEFKLIPSQLFYVDGIHPQIQKRYEVGYDVISGRIVVPWRDTKGSLVGVMGRVNSKTLDDNVPKWHPIIPFSKSKTIYSFDKNYSHIQNNKVVFIGESEKFCMQLESFDVRNGLSVGGSFISDIQARNVQSLMPNIAIVGFDEGLDEEHIREQAKKIKLNNSFINTNVGYIFDKHNKYLPKGSKASPSDLGKDVFKKLCMECVQLV